MNNLPVELISDILSFSQEYKRTYLVSREFYETSKEGLEREKWKNTMNGVLKTFILDKFRLQFRRSGISNFDFYLLHNLTNNQEIDVARDYWLDSSQNNNLQTFINNLDYISGNTTSDNERAINEYIEEGGYYVF